MALVPSPDPYSVQKSLKDLVTLDFVEASSRMGWLPVNPTGEEGF
jgi:hypothetical protein